MIRRPIVCRRFIGRRDELAFLHERRRAAGASHGGLILLEGEAGLGKSRLLTEFLASLAKSRYRLAQSACLEFAQRPYGPVLGLLAQLDPKAELVPASSKHEQFEQIVEAFKRAASRAAVVAIVEDLHWADVATVELLIHLCSKLASMRMLIVASLRPEEFHREHAAYAGLARLARTPNAARIELPSLDEHERQIFIDEALGTITLPFEARRAVAHASDGNPFFIEELLKSAVDGANAQAPPLAGLPPTMQSTLIERLRPLAVDERRVVEQAAVIGPRFELDVLAETLDAGVASLLPALRRARDLQLIEEDGPAAFRFRHALTRRAIYDGYLRAEIRPLHRRIAEVYERRDLRRSLESLAYHWWAAGDDERTARYNEIAGDAAAALHAHDDAIAAYERAAGAVTGDDARRAAILEKIGDRRLALADYAGAAAAFGAAADLYRAGGRAEAEATCRVRVAMQKYSLELPDPAAELELMLARLPANEYVAASRAHVGVAWIAASFYRPSLALQHLDAVDERAIAQAVDVAVRFFNVRAWVRMLQGDVRAFRADHAAWLAAARRAGGAGVLSAAHANGAWCFALLGLHDEAQANLRAAISTATDERSRHALGSAYAFSAFCALVRGDLTTARASVDEMGRFANDGEVQRAHEAAWGTLAGIHLGDDAFADASYDRLGGTVSPFLAAIYGAGCAQVLMRRGRDAEARAMLHDGIGTGERQRGNVLTLLAVARMGDRDDVPRARAVLERVADAPDELVERHALALFDAFVAHRDGRLDDAARLATPAADGFARLGFPLLEAAAAEVAGEVDRAVAIYRRCGAAGDLRRLRVVSAAATAPDAYRHRAARDPTLEQLTAREREIAALVADGHSNLEIAQRLAISHKTVEKHLGSAYAKLGVSSRVQLAACVAPLRRVADTG